jgi:hypothetical protein
MLVRDRAQRTGRHSEWWRALGWEAAVAAAGFVVGLLLVEIARWL